jgi:hypothetical protein
MSTIIGLGNAGCNIARILNKYPQYKTLYIDSQGRDEENFKLIEAQENIEKYEENFPSIKEFLEGTKNPYTVIVGGSGAISGAILRLLEQIDSQKISILYIKPDIDLLSEAAYRQERLVFHVLQQYARSSLLDKMFVVSNSQCEEALGDLTIKSYFSKINELIASTFHMYNVYQNIDPIIQTQGSPQEMCKIATFGLVDKDGKESLFYDLKFPREKHLYYSICKKNLESDASLIKNIKKQVRSFMTDKMKVSYSVYENNYDQDYVYSCSFASMIQEENYDFSLDSEE